MKRPSLYVISDRARCPALVPLVGAIARAAPGEVAFQLREKDLPARALYELACALVASLAGTGAPLLINDRIDVALAAGAQGVHLALSSVGVAEAQGLGLVVGASTHSAAELAARAGADFYTFGPVYETPSKRAYGPPVGEEALAAAAWAHPGRVYALGGVTDARAHDCIRRGAAGVAVIGAVWGAADPVAAACGLLRAIHGA